MNKQKGLTLILCLLFMSIMLLLLIHNINTALLEIKMAQWMRNESQHFIWAEQCLQKAEREFSNKPCQIDARNTLAMQDLAWWTPNNTCQVAKRCRYVYQKLSAYPCLVDETASIQWLAFYRFTVLVADENNEKVLLQSILAVPESNKKCEQTEKFVCKMGRQAWHQIGF